MKDIIVLNDFVIFIKNDGTYELNEKAYGQAFNYYFLSVFDKLSEVLDYVAKELKEKGE